jgi:ankyrin repeat protein
MSRPRPKTTSFARFKAGATIQTKMYGQSTLIQSIRYKSQDNSAMERLLIDNDVDVNATCPRGETALVIAARLNRPNIMRLLIDKGARFGFVDPCEI